MGIPLSPRQGSALSEVWFPYSRATVRRTFREGVAGRNGPQRWEAESRRIEVREDAYSRQACWESGAILCL